MWVSMIWDLIKICGVWVFSVRISCSILSSILVMFFIIRMLVRISMFILLCGESRVET